MAEIELSVYLVRVLVINYLTENLSAEFLAFILTLAVFSAAGSVKKFKQQGR